MKYNKEIAFFMGFKSEAFKNERGEGFEVTLNGVPENGPTFSCAEFGSLEHNIHTVLNFKGINYHSDWNWLMPVVEQIESLGHEVSICQWGCQIKIKNITKAIVQNNAPDKITAVYNSVSLYVSYHHNQLQAGAIDTKHI